MPSVTTAAVAIVIVTHAVLLTGSASFGFEKSAAQRPLAEQLQLFRSYFRCEPCESVACDVLPALCERVRERGVCACCYTCARQEGERCGIYTERCGKGLRCRTEQEAARSATLGMLMSGKARCLRPALGEWAGGEGGVGGEREGGVGGGGGGERRGRGRRGGGGSPLRGARHADERQGTLSAAGSR